MIFFIKNIIYSFLLFYSFFAYSNIQDINHLEVIYNDYLILKEKYVPEDILIVLEVPVVVLKPLVSDLKKFNQSQIFALSKLYNSVNNIKKLYLSTLILTSYDNELSYMNLPNIIENIQRIGSSVMALDTTLTGRFNEIKKLEIWKVNYFKKFNIDFSRLNLSDEYLIFNNMRSIDNTYPVFYKGILNTNTLHVSEVLINFLVQIKFNKKCLIYVGSQLEEMKNIELQLKNYNPNIKFLGYYLPATSVESKNYNNVYNFFLEITKKAQSIKRKIR